MKKKLSLFLAAAMMIGLLPQPIAKAADNIPDALKEVNVYADDQKLTWLTHSGSIVSHEYTYYMYENIDTGEVSEIPAYCVNPNKYGVGQVVGEGEPVVYLTDRKETDQTLVNIVANGYPHMSLESLGLSTPEEGYYATKTAIWCHIQSNWSSSNLAINSNLNSADQAVAANVLQATQDIYWRGVNWDINLEPSLIATADQTEAYETTINGESYYQQIFTVTSATWCNNSAVFISINGSSPSGTKLVDLNNNEITYVTMETVGDGSVSGQFKVIYPSSSVVGQSGSVQVNLNTTVVQYAIYYAICGEVDEYGELQNYLIDTDPHIPMATSVESSYSPEPPPPPGDGNLRIVKLQNGTEIPLSGAVFEIITPSGQHLGSYATNENGEISIDVVEFGNYTITELTPPKNHNLGDMTTQNVIVKEGETAQVTFWNDPYGSLKILKVSDKGDKLDGVTFQIKHIASGEVHTGTTTYGGEVIFTELPLGGYEVREVAGIDGYVTDLETVKTVNVVSDETVTVSFVNEEMPGLKIIKYDRVTMERLPNVTFDVKFNGNSIGQHTTDALGEITLLNLPVGTYSVTEVQSDNDHITDGSTREVYLDSGMGIVEFVFFNDQKPEMKLIKVDSRDLSVAIPNVKFEIKSVDGTYGPVEYTTDENGEINLSHLNEGAYVVTELQTADGYIIDNAQRIIELRANQTAEFVFTNSRKPELQIIKTDKNTGEPVGGVTFVVKKADGETITSVTTDKDGQATVVDLDEGVYEVTETGVPEGYILDATPQMITLVANKTGILKFQNYKKGTFELTKVDIDGKVIPNAVFNISAKDSTYSEDFTTDSKGQFLVENLEEGYYIITEKSVPHPYILDETPREVYIEAGKNISMTVENNRHPNLTIKKVDSITGSALDGAEFTVWYAVNGSLEGDLRKIGTYTTNDNGEIFLEAVEIGWYRIEETKAPSGYSTNSNNVQDVFLKADVDQTITFENTPLGALIIKKVDATTGEVLQGAKFRLRYFSGVSGTEGTVIGEYETDVTGTIIVTGLEKGTYMIQEFFAPDGYIIDDAPQTVYMTGEEQDVILIEFENQPDSGLFVVKVDALTNEPLEGATFKVETDDGTVVGNYDGIYTTDENGMFHIPNLPTDSYVVTELQAPEGYHLDAIPQTVKLIHGETHRLSFANYPYSGLIIVKEDALTKELLQGAVFKVEDSSGAVVGNFDGIYTTDDQGSIYIPNLPVDTYVVTEIKAPEGYFLDSMPQTVKLISGETHRIFFSNMPNSGLYIYKQDKDTKEPLANAVFKVTRDDGIVVGEGNGFFTTDEDGLIHITGLDTDTYVVTEVEAPEGYLLDSTPQTVKLAHGDTHHLYFYNEKIPSSSLLITKIDAQTREPLRGATFKVVTKNGTTVGTGNSEFTTDSTGTILLTDLPLDTYVVTEVKAPEGYVLNSTPQTMELFNGQVHNMTFENDPYSGLVVSKIDAQTKAPLQGATFKVERDDGSVVGTNNGIYTTDENGSFHIPNLETDTYIVTETIAPEGYVLDSTPQTIKLEYGQTHTLTFTNQPNSGLWIYKQDIDSKEPLAGAVFKVTKDNGAVVGNANGFYTTDEDGLIHIPNLETDTYIVVETTAPEGYVLNEEPQTIKLIHGETHNLMFYNEKIPEGGLLIRKLDEQSREPIEGVEFKITKKTGDLVGNYTTDENGLISLPDLTPDWYTIYEVKAADGYIIDVEPRDVQIIDKQETTVEITNWKESAFLIHKVCSVTGEGLQGVVFLLYDNKHNPIGQYESDSNGYVLMDENLADGQYFIRELTTIDGYILDDTLRTFYVKYGETALITWENVPQMAQLQITKKSADANPYNGMLAGTLLPDAVFEIISKKGVVVDTVKTDSYGRAVSKMLPLGQYTIREIEAPMYYMVDITEIPVELEFVGQIVKVEMLNYSAYTNVSIDKIGYNTVTPNQTICYDITNIANNSTVALDSFYWRDTLPVAGATVNKIVTGTYNQLISYKVVYKTNLNDYRTLSDNLSTHKNNVLEVSPVSLGLASNEYVTEVMFVFGNVMAGFRQVETAQIYCTTHSYLTNGFQFVNNCDVGGIHNGQWIMSNDRWLTSVIAPTTPPKLPQTGY